jgi:uncharacterized protein YqfA (UPF0365 family)
MILLDTFPMVLLDTFPPVNLWFSLIPSHGMVAAFTLVCHGMVAKRSLWNASRSAWIQQLLYNHGKG